MTALLWIALGGGLGALMRHGLGRAVHRALPEQFPYGTLAANLCGCLLIGLAWGWLERVRLPPQVAPFLLTGVIGAFTTFSTYSLESIQLMRTGHWAAGLTNIAVSNAAGLALVFLGLWMAE
ncbi:fluoride efflux transporter CrcB [Salisaeta longa]|uniref:fluoride efflux transporter CrcB n=1 Tax=Salisaeta longa TaxID=503170 RepID=UPI0003B7671B|nr:fluoride efflux transporter CrcB [Salisaeta longa]